MLRDPPLRQIGTSDKLGGLAGEGSTRRRGFIGAIAGAKTGRLSLNGAACVYSSLASAASARPQSGPNLPRFLNIGFSTWMLRPNTSSTSIERLRSQHLTSHGFGLAASQALKRVLLRQDSCNCVIALPPSGLLGGYWNVVRGVRDATIVVLCDTPENILKRITFYDSDSHPVQKDLTDSERGLHFREIKRDIAYFSRSFRRAHVSVDIASYGPGEAARKVRDALKSVASEDHSGATEQRSALRRTFA